MALKDWKKIINKRYHIEWENTIRNDAFIKVVDYEAGDLSDSGYVIYIRPHSSQFAERKEFSKKKYKSPKISALAFAKKYMRSH